jgi:hypothetical protein
MRLPTSGARKTGSAMNRSMPNFMVIRISYDFKRKGIGMMEIRLARWMS